MPAQDTNPNNNSAVQHARNGGGHGDHDSGVDTNLYSRQMSVFRINNPGFQSNSFSYALGESAMAHLRKASVLVSGLGSVGVEIAKNLILGLLFAFLK